MHLRLVQNCHLGIGMIIRHSVISLKDLMIGTLQLYLGSMRETHRAWIMYIALMDKFEYLILFNIMIRKSFYYYQCYLMIFFQKILEKLSKIICQSILPSVSRYNFKNIGLLSEIGFYLVRPYMYLLLL